VVIDTFVPQAGVTGASASLASLCADEFVAAVRPHLAKMERLAERLGGTAAYQDIVQDALINAWTKRAQFDPARGTLAAWPLAITADQARKSWRRQSRKVGFPALSSAQAWPDDRADVENAIRRLSPRQRLAIECFYFADLSVAETAAVMGCSEGTVKATLHQARAGLRPMLEVRE
jgi:RNA polymerase sigma factor (sigma-70 family)